MSILSIHKEISQNDDPIKFVFKHKKTQEKVALYLESGQLIVMHGETQRFWKHTITKTKTVDTGRISLTFRQMLAN